MTIPAINTVVTNTELLDLCEEYGLAKQAEIIKKDPPKKPFKSDGASCFPDRINGVDIYPAAFLHDIKYWCGYPQDRKGRLQADLELAADVMELCGGSAELAETMLAGVRAGGAAWMPTPWRWGFGR